MNIRLNLPQILPLTVACAALLIAGCGSGGGNNTDDPVAINGKVLGSLVEGAIVCVDENENGRCDSTDLHRIFSSADGSFQIGKIPASLFDKPLVVEVPLMAMIVDPVSGAKSPVATEYRLSYPPSEADDRFVSSLSTLVNSEFLQLGDLATATEAVTGKLTDAGVNIGASSLLDDYVARATDAAATADDIGVYNVAKLAGQVMQIGHAATSNNTAIDASALMRLVVQRVFDSIDVIEQMARENQALINQASAVAIVGSIGETRDLQISEADIETAAQQASLAFDLGPVAYANVLNFKEGNAAAEWRRVSYIRFETPGGADGRDVHDYRATIPVGYEIGVLDANGDLQSSLGFDEEQWEDGADPQVWYDWEDNSSVFAVYTRAATGDWDEGGYEYVLCPTGCDAGERIHLADATLAPYDVDLDIGGGGNFAALDDVVANELQFFASEAEGLRNGDEQLVTIAQPSPPHGTYYNVYLGIDEDGDGAADSTRTRGTTRSLNRVFVPADWLDDPHDFVALVAHRDRVGWENISWEARTGSFAVDVAREASFPTEEIFDIYRGEINGAEPFREGLDSQFYVYLAEGNPLVGLAYEDADGNEVASICLPNNIPSTQAGLAGYRVNHVNDGTEDFFDGCENFDILAEFGVTGANPYADFWIEGATSRSADEEVLIVGHSVTQEDSDGTWGETNEIFQDMKTVVLEFQDGSIIRFPTDLVLPEHDFTIAGDAALDICSVGQDSLRVSWMPPGWMLEEFNAGELSVSLRIRARDGNGSQLGSYTNRSFKGALSTVVSKTLLQNLADPGETIDHFRIEPYIGDMDYYNWKHRTYWTWIREQYSATEVLSAVDCV